VDRADHVDHPGHNDSEKEIALLSEWVARSWVRRAAALLAFTDFKMTGFRHGAETLRRAPPAMQPPPLRLHGNLHDVEGDPLLSRVREPLIVRDCTRCSSTR